MIIETQHRALVETLLMTGGVSHVQATLQTAGINYAYNAIDKIRREMERDGKRRLLRPPAVPLESLASPVDEASARIGSDNLLNRQLETGQYFPVQRALYLARHSGETPQQAAY